MPRTARAAAGGVVCHVLNRGNGRMGIFRKPGDYQAFLDLLREGKEKASIELFGFCLMPRSGSGMIYYSRRWHEPATAPEGQFRRE